MNTDISKQFPQWQLSIREAQESLNTPSYPRTDAEIEALQARGQARIQGRNLYFVLKNIFGIPVATPSLDRNLYTVDGFAFALKVESVPNEDERQPVYQSTSGASKSQQAVTFTLYVSKVVADPDYPDWPLRRVIVGRNVHLQNAGYSRLRAELAECIDDLEAAYQDELPRYQAWKAADLKLPSDAEALQDYFLQLMRRALRQMPAAEILPDVLPMADAADAEALCDGMVPGAGMRDVLATALTTIQDTKPSADAEDEVTFESLEVKANQVIALLDELFPPDDDDDDGKTPSPEDYTDEATEPDAEPEPV